MAENIHKLKNKLGCEFVSMFIFTQSQKKSNVPISLSEKKKLLNPSEEQSENELL